MKNSILFVFLLLITYQCQSQLTTRCIGSLTTTNSGCSKINFYNSKAYIFGSFENTIDFDLSSGIYNLATSGTGDVDLFFAKYTLNGDLVWARKIAKGSTTTASITQVLVDSLDNVYVVGSFSGPMDMDPIASHYGISSVSGGYNDIFFAKYDSLGNFIWAKTIGGWYSETLHAADIDNNGSLIFSGSFSGTIDFDLGPSVFNLVATGISSAKDIFLAKYTSSGALIWAKAFNNVTGSSSGEFIIDCKVTEFNNIIIIGQLTSSIDLDPTIDTLEVTASGGSDAFFAKYDSFGNVIWGNLLDFTGGQACRRIAVDNDENVYITGGFIGTCDFDPDTTSYLINVTGTNAAFISKYDLNGDFVFAKVLSGAIGVPVARSINVDNNKNIYLAGEYSDTVDFDPSVGIFTLISSGNADLYLAKYDSSGNFVWVNSGGGPNYDLIETASILNDTLIGICGVFIGTADIDISSDTVFATTPGSSDNGFFSILSQNLCSSFNLIIDSASNVSCFGSGYAGAHSLNAAPFYYFEWNTTPISNDSIINIIQGGIYTITLTDFNGCQTNRSVLISAPDTSTTFDLDVNLIATSFRPGQSTLLSIDAFNRSCFPTNGSIIVVLDTLLLFDSSFVAPNTISGDSLIWNFNSINFDSLHVVPKIFCHAKTSTSVGDTVCITLFISPISGDANITNNYKTYCFPVLNGYDPNDKQVYPQGECPGRYIEKDETITYTVRFQNTGNADAINIYILDSLDVNLDLNSVRVVGNSHELITEVLPGNVLKFRFDNIYLPDSTSDEPNSHGYVIYEVNALPTAPDGIIISNKAEIYFDFNPPIVTNSVWNTLVDTIVACNIMLSNEEYTPIKYNVQVYPNPTNGNVTIKTGTLVAEHIQVSDLSGRTIFSFSPQHTSTDLNLNQIEKGVYLITVTVNGKKETIKLVKQ